MFECQSLPLYLAIFIILFDRIPRLVHVNVLSCEHTCATNQHYKAFQYFIVTAIKTYDNEADLMLI